MTSAIDLFGDLEVQKILKEKSLTESEKNGQRLKEEISLLEMALKKNDGEKMEEKELNSIELTKCEKNKVPFNSKTLKKCDKNKKKINKNKAIKKNNTANLLFPRRKTTVVSDSRQIRPSAEATLARKSMTLRLLQHVMRHTDFKGNIRPSFYTDSSGHAEFMSAIQKLKYGEYQQLFSQSLNDESHALKVLEHNLNAKK